MYFYVLAPSDDNKVRIKILDATVFITQVELKPVFLLTLMFWKWNAKHIILLHTLKLKLLMGVFCPERLYRQCNGPIPERILIALVKNTAFVGSASTNQYHFQHHYMTNLVFNLNGVQLPSEPLIMDYSSPFGATSA